MRLAAAYLILGAVVAVGCHWTIGSRWPRDMIWRDGWLVPVGPTVGGIVGVGFAYLLEYAPIAALQAFVLVDGLRRSRRGDRMVIAALTLALAYEFALDVAWAVPMHATWAGRAWAAIRTASLPALALALVPPLAWGGLTAVAMASWTVVSRGRERRRKHARSPARCEASE